MAGIPPFFRLSHIPVAAAHDSCTFSFTTTLASPNATVLSMLKAGDVLQINFSETSTSLLATTLQGDVCGNIVSNIARIILCIRNEIKFEAKILKIDGAECQVLVQNS